MLRSPLFLYSLPVPSRLLHSCPFVLQLNCIHFLDFSIMKWLRPLLIDILKCLKLCYIIHSAAGNNFVPTSFCLCVIILVGYIPRMKLPSLRKCAFVILFQVTKLPFIKDCVIYTPTTNVHACLFLYTFANTI